MTAQEEAKQHFRIPEPYQVAAWLGSRWNDVRRALAHPETRAVFGVSLFGLILRLGFLDLVPMRAEIIGLLSQVAGLHRGVWPGLALTASGGDQPALVVFLLWLPSLISRDPRWLAAVQLIVQSGSLLLLYRLVRRRLGKQAALYVLILLSVNPWVIYYGRSLAAEAWFMPLAVGMLYGLEKALGEHSLTGWLVCMGSLVFLIYLSLSNATLGLVLLVMLLLYRRRIIWPQALLAMLIALLLLLPGLYAGNLARFALEKDWLRRWLGALSEPRTLLSTLKQIVWLQSGQRLELLADPVKMDWGAWAPLLGLGRLLAWLTMASLPVAIWSALRAWSRWRKRGDDVLLVLVSVWLTLGSATAFHPKVLGTGPGVTLTMMPVAAVAVALTVEWLLALPNGRRWLKYWWSQPLRMAFVLLLVVLALWQSYQTLHLNGHVSQRDVSAAYGTPFRYWRRTANLVKREARQEEIAELWLLDGEGQGLMSQAPELLDYLLHGQVTVIPLGGASAQGVLLPAARSGLYLSIGSAPLAERAVAQLGAEDRGIVLFPDGETRARVQFLSERPVDELLGFIQKRGLWAFDAGAKLLGYDWPPNIAPGQTINVPTYWTFVDMPPEDRVLEHRFFVRLIDARGDVLAESDGLALREDSWQSGYLLKQWWSVTLPDTPLPEQAYLLAGIYRPGDGYRNQYVDAQGQALGDAVLLGPVPLTP